MGRAATRKRRDIAEDQAERVGEGDHAAAQIQIKQTLRALILTAESADLRFLAYLLRMALLEADGAAYKRGE